MDFNELTLQGSKNSESFYEHEQVELEAARIAQFKKIKMLYQSQSIWTRLVNKINRCSPNWKKISDYSLKKLKFLEDVRYGHTITQHYSKDYYLKKEEENEINLNKFNRYLSSEVITDQAVKLEDALNPKARSR